MNAFLFRKTDFYPRYRLRALSLALLFLCALCPLFACKKSVNYFDYVSELRSNIFLAETEEYSLRIYAVRKETPYIADGIPQVSSARVEAYLVAPEGDKNCAFSCTVDGKEYGGEMSFDNVKCEYFFSCTLDVADCREIPCVVRYGEETVALNAHSVRTSATLSPIAALEKLQAQEPELFSSRTDRYGFAGEIYLRLIYEDAPFYYLGVIDRDGKINAVLMHAETGKILARRES